MSELKIIEKLTEDILGDNYFKCLFEKCSLINAYYLIVVKQMKALFIVF